jgi:hypothetical protein
MLVLYENFDQDGKEKTRYYCDINLKCDEIKEFF